MCDGIVVISDSNKAGTKFTVKRNLVSRLEHDTRQQGVKRETDLRLVLKTLPETQQSIALS